MNSTIVAQSTAQGQAAIAVIRLTGDLCVQLYRDCFGRKSDACHFRKAHFGTYKSLDNEPLDDVVYVLFEKGSSYTGEYMLEISCHGNPLVVDCIIKDLVARGCDLASPGEFTQRAFLNDRMDLTQAEAVCELIQAKSEQALRVAKRQLDGALSAVVEGIAKQWIHVIAALEAYIDFPEEDLPDEDVNGPLKELLSIKEQLAALLETRASKAALFDGPQVVIAGPPNAGKSSLFNRLLGFDRSIVSDVAGTTRDYVKESFRLNDICIDIIDTAGIHDSSDGLELAGIGLSRRRIEDADLCLLVVDASCEPFDFSEVEGVSLCKTKTLIVENKLDLGRHPLCDELFKGFQKCSVSVDTGEGLDFVCSFIYDTLGCSDVSAEGVMIGARHEAILINAHNKITLAVDKLKSSEFIECVISELREGLDELGGIVDKVDNEAVLDAIFGTFCIGK